jgi:hypothetical protein
MKEGPLQSLTWTPPAQELAGTTVLPARLLLHWQYTVLDLGHSRPKYTYPPEKHFLPHSSAPA